MKALVFECNDQPLDDLSWKELGDPEVGADKVLVSMLFSSVHSSDLHVVRVRFGRQPALPAGPGSEGMGKVEAFGSKVRNVTVGTQVVPLDVPGAGKELVGCAAARAAPVSDGLSDEGAVQAMGNPFTVWILTMSEHKLQRRDWIVQTAAGSAVGGLILQLAKKYGFHTISLVRRPEQIAEIKALGGEIVLYAADPHWAEQPMEATGGKGAQTLSIALPVASAQRSLAVLNREDAYWFSVHCHRTDKVTLRHSRCRSLHLALFTRWRKSASGSSTIGSTKMNAVTAPTPPKYLGTDGGRDADNATVFSLSNFMGSRCFTSCGQYRPRRKASSEFHR